MELAQAIVRDGEGATKFITVAVEGGRDAAECRKIALGIAHSPLVKTAFFASDPNLGRIVCAIGNAAAPDLDPSRVSFRLDDVLVVDRGGRAAVLPRGGRAARDEAGRDHGQRGAGAWRRVVARMDVRLLARLRLDQRRLPELTCCRSPS